LLHEKIEECKMQRTVITLCCFLFLLISSESFGASISCNDVPGAECREACNSDEVAFPMGSIIDGEHQREALKTVCSSGSICCIKESAVSKRNLPEQVFISNKGLYLFAGIPLFIFWGLLTPGRLFKKTGLKLGQGFAFCTAVFITINILSLIEGEYRSIYYLNIFDRHGYAISLSGALTYLFISSFMLTVAFHMCFVSNKLSKKELTPFTDFIIRLAGEIQRRTGQS
jgi:hypothetical protein